MAATLDLGTLICHLSGDSTGIEMAMNRGKSAVQNFSDSAIAAAGRYGVEVKQVADLQADRTAREAKFSEYATREEWNLSHTSLQNQIREMEEFYDKKVEGLEDCETAMTQITRIKTAARQRIEAEAFSQSEARFRWLLRNVVRTSIYAYLASHAIQAIADGMKTWRQTGGDFGQTFAKFMQGIPALGRVITAEISLINEISGLAEAMERIEAVKKHAEIYGEIATSVENEIQLLNARNETEKEAIKIEQEYAAGMKKISEAREKDNAVFEERKRIVEKINELLTNPPKAYGFSLSQGVLSATTIDTEKQGRELARLMRELAGMPTEGMYEGLKGQEKEKRELSLQASREAAEKKLDDYVKAIEKEYITYRMTNVELEIYEASLQNLGEVRFNIVKTKLLELDAWKKEKEAIKEQEKTMEELEKTWADYQEQFETPLEKNDRQFKETENTLIEMWENGIISAEQYYDYVSKFAKKFEDEMDKDIISFIEKTNEMMETREEKFAKVVEQIEAAKERAMWSNKEIEAIKEKYRLEIYGEGKENKPKEAAKPLQYDPRYISANALAGTTNFQTQLLTQSREQTGYQRKMAQSGIY